MTIGIGMLCPEGVVLAADTYAPKFKSDGTLTLSTESKIHQWGNRPAVAVVSGIIDFADLKSLSATANWDFVKACNSLIVEAINSQAAALQRIKKLRPSLALQPDRKPYAPPSVLAVEFPNGGTPRLLVGKGTGGMTLVKSGRAIKIIGAWRDLPPEVNQSTRQMPDPSLAGCRAQVMDIMARYISSYDKSPSAQQLRQAGHPLEIGFPFEVLVMNAEQTSIELCEPDTPRAGNLPRGSTGGLAGSPQGHRA